MESLERMKARYDIGQGILKQLFAMNDEQLKQKLTTIIGSRLAELNSEDILVHEKGRNVSRIIYNDAPKEITLEFYNWVKVDSFGIDFYYEHNPKSVTLVEFNEHFVL